VSPIVAASGWALIGALASFALRPMVAGSSARTSPGSALPAPGVLEGLTAAVFAALAYRIGMQLELLVLSVVAVTGVPLAALDLIARKLPNVLVGATYLGVMALLVLDTILNGPSHLIRALGCMAAAIVVHGVLYASGGLGGGDLKLVGVLAAALGWLNWTATWTGLVTGWLLASAAVLLGRAFRDKKRRPEVPLGLFLIIGTLTTALVLVTPH
jgi:leader peptidase (prepilin peptidase) / N-methyltransferase